jgi:phenylalanyl-tRNA synthetase beta chain
MKISRDWLQTFFTEELPESAALADALTFHAFEIDGIEHGVLDVKVTPNRGHDCLSHRGIAKELSAILDIPLKVDPFRVDVQLMPATDSVALAIDEPSLCKRYIAGYIRGVRVGASPAWLRDALESMGQRSINNVVDATNYVMFHIGQPLHAFDAGQLESRGGGFAIRVRKASEGERMVALDDKAYELSKDMLVISDGHSHATIGIAGVKGGKPAGITEKTTDIIIESANFDGVSVRKTASALKLRTDASSRFEQGLSADTAGYGMRAAADLILELAGGELDGFADMYPVAESKQEASVTTAEVNALLGTTFQDSDVSDVFRRLDFDFARPLPAGRQVAHTESDSRFTVHVPFERLDLLAAEDLVEEVGRIKGYDHVPSEPLPVLPSAPSVQPSFLARERMQDFLVARGFTEVYSSVFAEAGERVVANKVDGVRPYLRSTLVDGLKTALEKNVRNKDLLGERQIKIFEIGTVWHGGIEELSLGIAVENVKKAKGAAEYLRELLRALGSGETIGDEPSEVLAILLSGAIADSAEGDAYAGIVMPETHYRQYSKFPFIVRDIALWTPEGTDAGDVAAAIAGSAGELLARIDLFDRFEKDGKVSYAFRLVFLSLDKTLTDADANQRMESVYVGVEKRGWEVR